MEKIDDTLGKVIVEFFEKMGDQQAEWQRDKGWADEGDSFREDLEHAIERQARVAGHYEPGAPARVEADDDVARAQVALRNYNVAKLALIVTEVAEAIEEIRTNHSFGETYFLDTVPGGERREIALDASHVRDGRGESFDKPEGVLSELADVIIRIWSLTGEQGLGAELGRIIVAKLNYNATRALRHGGKAI